MPNTRGVLDIDNYTKMIKQSIQPRFHLKSIGNFVTGVQFLRQGNECCFISSKIKPHLDAYLPHSHSNTHHKLNQMTQFQYKWKVKALLLPWCQVKVLEML